MNGRRRAGLVTCGGGLRRARSGDHSARCTTVQPTPAISRSPCRGPSASAAQKRVEVGGQGLRVAGRAVDVGGGAGTE